MMTTWKWAVTLLCIAGASWHSEARGDDDHSGEVPKRFGVVGTAASLDDFSVLTRAIVLTGLVDDLRDDGPFTVFAPTDEAFAKLDKGTLASLLRPENTSNLANVLKYHVVPGRRLAKDLAGDSHPKTLLGKPLTIVANGRGLAVNDATVIKADIKCRNGVIHVVDRVLTPSQDGVLEVARKAGQFGTLIAAINAAGLASALGSDGPFTVFAPTDEAFAKLGKGTLKTLLQPDNKHKLIEILKYHVVPAKVSARQAIAAGEAKTLQGGKVEVKIADARLEIGGAKAIATDIPAANGVIHVIDSVLIPPDR